MKKEQIKFYTGVGSRETPKSILKIMYRLACKLEADGWTVRTGDADGADAAFRQVEKCQVFTANHAEARGIKLASKFHPAWNRCSPYARRLHGRNSYQVLGKSLNCPSSFIICWTRDAATTHKQRSIETGGTGTAISIGDHYHIPVFNLADPDHLNRMLAFLDGRTHKESNLYQITAPHFCAGIELRSPGRNHCAPILNYMQTWSLRTIQKYVLSKEWKIGPVTAK